MKIAIVELAVLMSIFLPKLSFEEAFGDSGSVENLATGVKSETGDLEAAFIGDSISTGAVTHPQLLYDPDRHWEIVTGNIALAPVARTDQTLTSEPTRSVTHWPSPQRLWPSYRTFIGGEFWLTSNIINAIGRLYIDTEEYAWTSILARRQGWPMNLVAIAAEDGARVEDIARQYDRVLDATGGRAPKRLFVYFTGNDLCAQSFEQLPTEAQFETALRRGLAYVYRNGRLPENGIDIYVPDYLGVVQLLTKPSIQSKEITAFSRSTTCKELRQERFSPPEDYHPARIPAEASYFSKFLPPNLANICPTIFGGPGILLGEEERVTALANRIRSYRRAASNAIAASRTMAAEHWSKRIVRFNQVKTTGRLGFEGIDIASDCFHLSYRGQRRVADAVATELRK